MGAWKDKGAPNRFLPVERSGDNEMMRIVRMNEKCHQQDQGVYMLRRSYSENASEKSVRKLVATLTGTGQFMNCLTVTKGPLRR